MKEFKGTKERWHWEYKSGFIRILDNKGLDVIHHASKKEAEANAKLIAEAFEMLQLLQDLENDNNSIPEHIWNKRNKLLNKILD